MMPQSQPTMHLHSIPQCPAAHLILILPVLVAAPLPLDLLGSMVLLELVDLLLPVPLRANSRRVAANLKHGNYAS